MIRATKQCKTCGGTGLVYEAKTWFTADGYRRSRCGICKGSGESEYQPNSDYARWQKERREDAGKLGAAP